MCTIEGVCASAKGRARARGGTRVQERAREREHERESRSESTCMRGRMKERGRVWENERGAQERGGMNAQERE